MNTLKTTLNILSLTAVGFAGTAKANYQCDSYSGDTSLIIKEYSMQRNGNASVEIQEKGEKPSLNFGFSEFTPGDFNQKKEIYLSNGIGTVTLLFEPITCGRGSCNLNSGAFITAYFKNNESIEDSYICHEILD
jgi:hypothetical protein